MKHKIGWLFSFVLTISFTTVCSQTKHALIFAIGNYPIEKGWSNLSSIRDAEVLNTVLGKQGFTDIRIYKNEQVTPRGIDSAFMSLINDKKLQKGDIVVVHFSAHGVQVEDNNADEVDRLDEAIVTYNAISPIKSEMKNFQIDQAEYFRDDKFGSYIDKLRARLGKQGDVIVFMDACHSGSGTRGATWIRGGSTPLVSENFNTNQSATIDIKGKELFKDNKSEMGLEKDLATYVVISAAGANENNSEAPGKKLGSLTYAIREVFVRLDSGTTYRSFFAKIKTEMNKLVHYQTPVLEGSGIDRELFGGKFLSQKPYVEIEEIRDFSIEVKAGLLSGLNIGAKVSIYPAGTIDPSKSNMLTSGTVTKATNYTATVKLDEKFPFTIKKTNQAWVFVSETVYKINPVCIEIRVNNKKSINDFSEKERADIINSFKDLPGFTFTDNPEVRIVKGEKKDFINIQTVSDGHLFNVIKDNGSVIESLKEELKRYSQYKFLRDFEVSDPKANVEVKLIPVINGRADSSEAESKMIKGNYEFNEGDQFVLWIKNIGSEPVYINILDLQPDGTINPIFPNRKARDANGNPSSIYPEDLLLDSFAIRLFSNYPITLGPPFGKEIFKVFVSVKKIDMEEIADSRGTIARGSFSGLEKLVKNSYSIASRNIGGENISTSDGSVFNVYFLIKKKK